MCHPASSHDFIPNPTPHNGQGCKSIRENFTRLYPSRIVRTAVEKPLWKSLWLAVLSFLWPGVSLIQICTSALQYCPPSEYTKTTAAVWLLFFLHSISLQIEESLGFKSLQSVQDEGTYFIASTAYTDHRVNHRQFVGGRRCSHDRRFLPPLNS